MATEWAPWGDNFLSLSREGDQTPELLRRMVRYL